MVNTLRLQHVKGENKEVNFLLLFFCSLFEMIELKHTISYFLLVYIFICKHLDQ